jgi:RNA polymerase sigma factor (sigma-70 family)
MARHSPVGVARSLETLFRCGPIGDLSDGDLLERFVATRDEAAFEVLVARHGPVVLHVCRAVLSDRDEVEDAFQAVFLVLARRASAIRSSGSVASWLFGVATRVSARARADAGRRRWHERMAARRGDPMAVTADLDDRPDPAQALREEIARLPERYREAIVLHDLEGHTCEAMARQLRRPVGTVRARLCRARGILKRRLLRRGIAVPAGLVATGALAEASVTLATVPSTLTRAAVAAACGPAAGVAMASARASQFAKGAIDSMIIQELGRIAALSIPAALVAGTVLIARGSASTGGEPRPRAEAQAAPPAAVSPRPEGRIAADDAAGRALQQALTAGTAMADPYYFTFALIRLAKSRNAVGDREGALAAFRTADRVAATVKNEHLRRLALMRTAVARGRIGDVEPARATLDHFAREAEGLLPEARSNLMSMVIDFYDQAGFKAQARSSLEAELARVEAIADERIRDAGIHRFLYSQIAMGDYDRALGQAERYQGKRSNYRASLVGIILHYRSLGSDPPVPRKVVDRAIELVGEVTYPYPRALALAEIAPALARSGDIDGALALARDIGKDAPSPFGESARAEIPSAMAAIARIQARTGDLDGARKTLREALAMGRLVTERGSVLSHRIRRVGEAAAEIGDVEAARESAEVIEDDEMEKVLALVALARAELKAGDATAARATLRNATTRAGNVGARRNMINDDPAGNADEVFREVVKAQAEAGDVKGAVATVSGRGSVAWKSEVLAAIAPIQARQGDIPGALVTAGSIPEPARSGEAYGEIASIQARAGGAEPVLAWAARLEPPAARAFAMIGLAEGVSARPVEGRAKEPGKP